MNKERYENRVNRAIALIDRQIEQELSIARLAAEACLSPFHFHRIFSALTGESVHAMTTRMRMQRALALTRRGQRPQMPGRLSGASQDDPELVPLSRCRCDFTLEVPEGTKAPKGLHSARRAEGRWAMAHLSGELHAVDRAWSLLFKIWLPGSGLNLRDVPAEEIYNLQLTSVQRFC